MRATCGRKTMGRSTSRSWWLQTRRPVVPSPLLVRFELDSCFAHLRLRCGTARHHSDCVTHCRQPSAKSYGVASPQAHPNADSMCILETDIGRRKNAPGKVSSTFLIVMIACHRQSIFVTLSQNSSTVGLREGLGSRFQPASPKVTDNKLGET